MTTEMLIRITSHEASDSWGFVGVVLVGEVEAYRTLEAFSTPSEAAAACQRLVADAFGEVLAGREWRPSVTSAGRCPPARTSTSARCGPTRWTPPGRRPRAGVPGADREATGDLAPVCSERKSDLRPP